MKIPNTSMFKSNAVGFIKVVGNERKLIKAKWPLEPP